jgi:5-methylcytosine-specific restriction protein A
MLWFSNKKIRYAIRSSRWSSVRKQHITEYPKCAACGRSNKVEVHHIEPVHVNPDRELDPSNLITLCDSPCHLVFGHLMDYKSWNEGVVKDCDNYNQKIKNKP